MTDAQRQRFDSLIEQGSFYEAEQMCTALYHRLQRSGKKQEAFDLLLYGARQLAKGEQFQCAFVLLDKAQEYMKKQYFSEESFSQVLNLLGTTFPNHLKPKVTLLNKLEKLASEKHCSEDIVHKLHKFQAETCIGMEDYRRALSYYSFLNDTQLYTSILEQWMSEGLYSEEDLFVTRQILCLLAQGKRTMAKEVFKLCLQKHDNLNSSPLIGFIYLLLECLERNLFSSLESLIAIYKPVFDRDANLWKLLHEAIDYSKKHR
ncbi:Golgi to ER traffic protein 4 [Galdieria sulphuraria]|nr:Golgi to ER traffic protein 4 [Galdieria sulphuraria]